MKFDKVSDLVAWIDNENHIDMQGYMRKKEQLVRWRICHRALEILFVVAVLAMAVTILTGTLPAAAWVGVGVGALLAKMDEWLGSRCVELADDVAVYELEHPLEHAGWLPVSFARDCEGYDEDTGEMGDTCSICKGDYVECPCPGPSQDEEYEYELQNGTLMARRRPTTDE